MRRKHVHALGLCLYLGLSPVAAALAQEPAEHHEAAQAAGEPGQHAEAAGHEGHEGGSVIENWWDYGKRNPPPFGVALFNFAVFLGILYALGGKNFREFLRGRSVELGKALDEAAEIRRQAEAQLQTYKERIAGIDAQMAELMATVRREAEAERARIIAAAEAQAKQLKLDAEAQIQSEIARARADLRRATVQAAMQAAESLLKEKTQEADQKRLVEDYVARMEALAPSAASQRRTSR